VTQRVEHCVLSNIDKITNARATPAIRAGLARARRSDRLAAGAPRS
jgi:hypothetical protein